MGKHTPGPWKAFNVSDVFTDRQDEFAEVYVADCSMDALTNDEVEANARLIAAAPELLDVVVRLHALVKGESPLLLDEDFGGDGSLDLDILAAIAKATGESHG